MSDKITAAEFRARQAQAQESENKRVKGAQRVTVGGITFDSKAEAERWGQLQLLQAAGEICDLQRQVRIPLEGRDGPIMTDGGTRQRTYVADFVYFDRALGAQVIEDRKGHATEVFNIKRAILEAQGVKVMVT